MPQSWKPLDESADTIENSLTFALLWLERARQCSRQEHDRLSLHPSVASAELWLRFRGPAIAKWDDGRVSFGTSDRREELTAASWPALKKLLRDLETLRHPFSSVTRSTAPKLSAGWKRAFARRSHASMRNSIRAPCSRKF